MIERIISWEQNTWSLYSWFPLIALQLWQNCVNSLDLIISQKVRDWTTWHKTTSGNFLPSVIRDFEMNVWGSSKSEKSDFNSHFHENLKCKILLIFILALGICLLSFYFLTSMVDFYHFYLFFRLTALDLLQ